MAFQFIAEFDVLGNPEHYAQYLRETYKNSKRILGLPEQQWPKGSSHEISRQIMQECDEAYCDLNLTYGLYDAFGKLVGYSTE